MGGGREGLEGGGEKCNYFRRDGFRRYRRRLLADVRVYCFDKTALVPGDICIYKYTCMYVCMYFSTKYPDSVYEQKDAAVFFVERVFRRSKFLTKYSHHCSRRRNVVVGSARFRDTFAVFPIYIFPRFALTLAFDSIGDQLLARNSPISVYSGQ